LLKITKTFLANDTKVILRFRFERTTFTWELKSIEYESVGSNDVLFPQSFIGAQKGLSYFSEGPVVFSSNSIVLTFNDKFQVSFIFKLIEFWMFGIKNNPININNIKRDFKLNQQKCILMKTFIFLFLYNYISFIFR